ncbi:hypothetical protein CFC21_080321 [Triticum aestivum]|uniref:Uncharacterized protein n=2 Tax=Triticum aestivum TaxID=4565 RepID=A0A3B6N0R9_WHEAT|nr:hypothetical protein CFC21_080321 [Triticum aestivum]
MMAASLRTTATRILRLAGQGLRRLVHTQQQSRSTPSLEDRAAQIQQKREELYDLIARAQSKKVGLFSTASQEDRHMLRILCTQIKPRPNDPQWYNIYQPYFLCFPSATGLDPRWYNIDHMFPYVDSYLL